jgi:CTP synthase
VAPEAVLSAHDVSNLYRVPLLLLQQGALSSLIRKLHLPVSESASSRLLEEWRLYAEKVDHVSEPVHIAIVGKYTGFQDSYQVRRRARCRGLSGLTAWAVGDPGAAARGD